VFKEYDISFKRPSVRILTIALLTVLILFGTHFHILSLAAFAISCIILIVSDSQYKIILIIYLMMMAHIFKISPSGMSYFTLLMLLYIFIDLIKKKKIMWAAIAFTAFVIIIQIIYRRISVTDDLKLIVNILFISCAMKEICNFSLRDKDKVYISYIISVIVSSVMRFFDSSFFNISDYTLVLKEEAFGANTEGITRFSGLYQDPNYYTVNLILALCFLVILYYENSVSPFICILGACCIIYFGSLTYSKSFILFLLLPFSFLVYANYKLKRAGAQIIIFMAIAGLVAFLIISNSHFLQMMQLRMETGTSLTTGRSDIWETYLDYILNRPTVALFGVGIGAPLLDDVAIHNSYIECFYHLGIVGIILLVFVIAKSGVKSKKRIKRNLLNFAPLLIVLVTYAGLSQLHDYEFPLHFMLVYMQLFLWDSSISVEYDMPKLCPILIPNILDNKVNVLLKEEDYE
jgi:hypothetical protein